MIRKYTFGTKGVIHHSIYVFGVCCWSFYYSNRFGWFRMLGRGLKFKDGSVHGLTFGERHGYSKSFIIGKWRVGIL